MNSIHTKLMVLPDNTVVYSGHDPVTTIGTEPNWNPFLRGWYFPFIVGNQQLQLGQIG